MGLLHLEYTACCQRQTPDSDLLKGALSNLLAIRAQINISCCVTHECAIAISGYDISNSTPGSLSETERVAGASSALEKCSFLKYKDRGSIPRTHVEKLGMMVHICSSSTGEVEAGEGPWGHTSSQPTLLGGCAWRLKPKVVCPLVSTRMNTCVDEHTHNTRKGLDTVRTFCNQARIHLFPKVHAYLTGCMFRILLTERNEQIPYWTNPLLVEQIPHWSQINKIPYWFWIHRDLISRVASGPILKLWVGAPGSIEVDRQAERTEKGGKRKRQNPGWHGGDTAGPEIKYMRVRQAQ